MIEALRDFQLSIPATVAACVRENEAVAIDMNAEEQLFEKGENRLGVKISDYRPYSPVTVEYKRLKGQPYDRVTLRDEGDFESSFHVRVEADSVQIAASDPKTGALIRKYGPEILGLNAENLQELTAGYIQPALCSRLVQTLNNRAK